MDVSHKLDGRQHTSVQVHASSKRRRRLAANTTRLLQCIVFITFAISLTSILLCSSSILRPSALDEELLVSGFLRWKSSQWALTSLSAPWAVFYNVFIPEDEAALNTTLQIISEQIDQIGNSRGSRRRLSKATVYYNTIGSTSFQPRDMDEICSQKSPSLHCQHLRHYPKADEKVTLHALWSFCQEHPDYRVTYLHPKGSYHSNEEQDNWRFSLTEAALSRDCIDPPNATCNLCGLHFFARFTTFVPGNMWTAQCSYISKLLPPDGFEAKQEEVIGKMLLLRLRGQIVTKTFPDERKDRYGLDRYTAEHWVASHPAVRPCDMDPSGDLNKVHAQKMTHRGFQFGMAPRSTPRKWFTGRLRDRIKIERDIRLRRREYFLLPGLLFKWLHLYGEAPSKDSWAWQWFPDGDYWKEMVDIFETKAVEQATLPYYENRSVPRNESDHVQMSSFAESPTQEIPPEVTGDTGMAIFYQGWDVGWNYSLVDAQFKIINDTRLSGISGDKQPSIPIFIDTIDVNTSRLAVSVREMCGKYRGLRCQDADRSLKPEHHGETLSRLHSFCQKHPNSRVAFIHNNVTDSLPSDLLLHMTQAVTSQGCLEPKDDDDSCDVCSLVHVSLYTMQFLGNIFATDCSYVNRLLAPKDYEVKTTQVVESILLAKARQQLTTELLAGQNQLEAMGIDRYSIHHWIGSHPSIIPCQVALANETLPYWKSLPVSSERTNDFASVLPPVHDLMNFNLNQKTLDQIFWVMNKLERRKREYSLLPGHLMKWYHLYGEAPPTNSWIWNWFPDGDLWQDGVARYGKRVVEEITAEFDNLESWGNTTVKTK
jgi:hypothetical protein